MAGCAYLAGCAFTASWSQVLLGGDLATVAAAALHGDAPACPTLLLLAWAVAAVIGARWCYQGVRAALGHDDPFNELAFLWSGLVVAIALYALRQDWFVPWQWFLPYRALGTWVFLASRGLWFMAMAYGVAGMALQLRGPVAKLLRAAAVNSLPLPRPVFEQYSWQQNGFEPMPQWQQQHQDMNAARLAEYEQVIAGLLREVEQGAQQLATWQEAVAERDAAIAGLADERNRLADSLRQAEATRDRYQANGKRIAAEKRELEAALKIPGVLDTARKAALKSTHPDGATNDFERRARTICFQERAAVFDRIGDRLKAAR